MTLGSRLGRDTWSALRLWRVWGLMAVLDLKGRFRRSVLGPAWLVASMMTFVLGVGFVYGNLFGQAVDQFLPFLMIGFIIWGLLASSLTEAANAFLVAEGYLKQFPHPKQTYVLRHWWGGVLVFALSFLPVPMAQAVLSRVDPMAYLLALPGLALLLLACLGQTALFAYLGARFRDLPHLAAGMLQIVFLVTPILFPASVLDQKGLGAVYLANPLYALIDVVRAPLLGGDWAPGTSYLIALAYVVVVWLCAMMAARRLDVRIVFLL